MTAALRRHRGLVAVMGVAIVGFVVFGLVTDARLAIPYGVIVLGGGLLVASLEPDRGYSEAALCGLCLWALGHLAGGIVGIGDDRTFYNAITPGGIHVDNIVHFIGFGTAGLVWWEATRPWLVPRPRHRIGVGVAVWLAGMGAGALNEVLEFAYTLVDEHSNVGGYHNTGRDLIANMLGAAVAGTIAARRQPD